MAFTLFVIFAALILVIVAYDIKRPQSLEKHDEFVITVLLASLVGLCLSGASVLSDLFKMMLNGV